MILTPTDDRVLIEMDPFDPEFGDSGLVRPESVAEMPVYGTVRAHGPGRWLKKAKRREPVSVEQGDRVVIAYGVGKEIAADGVLFKLVRESDIIGIED